MDPRRFDALVRSLVAPASRRRVLAGLLPALLPALGALQSEEVDAAKRQRRAQRKKQNKRRDKKAKAKAKQRKKRARAEAAAGCCKSGNCSPGTGKNLVRCCFEGQDLTKKSFKSSNLTEANFTGANLTNANFASTNMTRACLVDATMTGANFKSANLSGVIRCRTKDGANVDNSGCHLGTPCCPTCTGDAQCGPGERCCEGRCQAVECCGNGVQSTCDSGEICCGNACVTGDCCDSGDCATAEFCCRGTCIANTQCCDGDPSTCPAPGVCNERACNGDACQPRALTGGTCPFATGGTGECSNGSCVCPSPRITCSDGCCPIGATACKADGTCGPGCDVCASGCPFTSLAAAVAGTPTEGTIRICPGTYATNNVAIQQKTLTIIGAGAGNDPNTDTILSGGNTTPVLSIVLADVTMQDLTVTEGNGNDKTGGIEVVVNSKLTLERVEVVGNTNTISPTGGNASGGISVYSTSTALIKSSRIANNTTQGGPSAVGGGIFNSGTVTVEATRIEGNSARGGGGIFNSTDAKLTINTGVVITENTATQPIGDLGPLGSGIYNRGEIVDNDPATNVFGNNPDNFLQCAAEGDDAMGCPNV